jgi:predicted RNase H-like nuclease (RuvC/YqgF family)
MIARRPPREELTNMTRGSKALTVVVVAALGLWGCAQGNGGDSAERVRQLENDCTRLKEDYRSVAGARDRLRQQVAELENTREQLQKDLEAQQALAKERQSLAKERDELVQQVGARTTERDSVQGQLDQVKKGLRALLGQTEAAVGGTPTPAASAAQPEGNSKS